jgi:O-antigen/teichoic acid export membrane protein
MSGPRSTSSLSIGRETLVSLASKVLTMASGFVGIVIFANVLQDVGLGEYRTVLAAAFVLTQVPSGIGSAVRKRVSEVEVDPGAYLGTGLVAYGTFVALVVAGYLVTRPLAVDYFGTPELAAGVVLVAASVGLFKLLEPFYAGTGYPGLASWLDSGRSLLTLPLQVGLLVVGMEAFGLVVGLTAATLVACAATLAIARVRPRWPAWATAERVYEFAKWSVPTNLLSNLYSSADVLVLRWAAGAGPVGYYAAALQLVVPGAMFSTSIKQALTVKSSGVDSAGGAVRRDLVNSLSYAGLFAIPIFFGALAIPRELMVTIFGSSFADDPHLALAGLALFQVSNAYRHPFEGTIEGTDRPELVTRVSVALVVVHLPLAVVLGREFGLLGVVGATLLAEVLRLGAFQYVVHRHYGGVVVTRPMVEQAVAGVGMFLVVDRVESSLLPVDSWLTLLVVVGVGAAAYFLALLAVSGHFRDTIRFTLLGATPDPDADGDADAGSESEPGSE